jgi:hypothetical protein
MLIKGTVNQLISFTLCIAIVAACNLKDKKTGNRTTTTSDEVQYKIPVLIRQILGSKKYTDTSKIDSASIQKIELTKSLYGEDDFNSLWSEKEHWLPISDSLYQFTKKNYQVFVIKF